MSNVWVFLFLAWPPVCGVQHEVPLRRCEEAERHPTGRLEDGRLRLHQQFRTEGFAADRDENVAQEGLVDERAGTRIQEHPVLCAGREITSAHSYHVAKAHVIDQMQLLMRST